MPWLRSQGQTSVAEKYVLFLYNATNMLSKARRYSIRENSICDEHSYYYKGASGNDKWLNNNDNISGNANDKIHNKEDNKHRL